MLKIKDTTYLYGVLPQASSSSMVRNCIPWTANMPPARHVVALASRSFVTSVAAAADATGPYPAHGC